MWMRLLAVLLALTASSCPAGKTCTMIYDGPGEVCQ
jgi:hypothetical protein